MESASILMQMSISEELWFLEQRDLEEFNNLIPTDNYFHSEKAVKIFYPLPPSIQFNPKRQKQAHILADNEMFCLSFAHLSVSGPFLAMIIFNLPSPPTGALSVPVVNCRKRRFCSSLKECSVSQNSLQGKVQRSEQMASLQIRTDGVGKSI